MNVSRIILYSALCLSVTAGCQSGKTTRPADRPSRVTSFFNRDLLNAEIAPPPGINEDLIVPLHGEALSTAKLSLRRVLAFQTRPEYLDAPSTSPVDGGLNTEPPLGAQLAYVKARTAWLEGDTTQAKQQLESALRLAPNEPTLLRLLGEVYSRTGNRVKGAYYFRQAVEIDPNDARSIYILGRFAVEKGEHGEAIVLFYDALIKAEDNPALTELTLHFLGNSLRSSGYVAAAIEQFDRYVTSTEEPIQTSRFARDQTLLRRQIGITYQLMGDLNLLMNRPSIALQAYDKALEAGVPDPVKVDKRRIYASMLNRDADLARELVIELLRRQRGDAQSLAMVRYAVNQGLNAPMLAGAIQEVYQSEGRPANLAIAASDILATPEAKALLIAHLEESPEDAEVFQRLLKYFLLPVEQAPHDSQTLAEAADLTARLMGKAPALADEYASLLVTHVPDAQALLEVLGESTPDQPDTMRTVLRGLCLAVQGDFAFAQQQFELAVKDAPDLQVARIELAKALIVQDQFEQAAEVLAPLSDSSDTGVILLRSRVLAETDQAEQAVDLIDRVIRMTGGDAKLVISKANLEIKLGRIEDAEQTLQDALNAQPTSEPIYEALLSLYDPAPGKPSVVQDQTAKWRILVKRLLGTIPNSRTGRLVQAQLYDASRNYDRAAAILEGLLAENPGDAKALAQLLDTYHAAGRTGEATALLESRLEASPENPLLLQIALRFYSQARDPERLFDVQQRLVMLQPDTPQRAGQLGLLYVQAGKYAEAIEPLESALAADDVENPVLLLNLLANALTEVGELELAEKRIRKAAERFPEHEAQLLYLLAMRYVDQGDQKASEQLLRDILAKHPDHGPSNNGLGYVMLMRDEDPGKALQMIQQAVDSDPENEAYMDSLGWAYYKLGKFEDAEVWLSKAKEAAMARYRAESGRVGSATLAVVNDHLGDTLYQLGREAEAMRSWSEAGGHMRRVTPEEKQLDPELEDLVQRVTDKIKAVRGKTPVPVANVPEPPKKEVAPKQADKPEQAKKPAAQPEPEPKPEAKTQPEPKPEPKPEVKPEPESKPKADETSSESKPQPEPDKAPEQKPESKPQPQPEPEPVAEQSPAPSTDTPEAQPDVQQKPKSDTEAKPADDPEKAPADEAEPATASS